MYAVASELLTAVAAYREEQRQAALERAQRDAEARAAKDAAEVARLQEMLQGDAARAALALVGLRPEECRYDPYRLAAELWGEVEIAPLTRLGVRVFKCGNRVTLALRMAEAGFRWETTVTAAELRPAIVQGVATALGLVERREQERDALLSPAEGVVRLAVEHVTRTAAYEAACRQWAAGWAAKLWEPWTLWAVRYAPRADAGVDASERMPVETLHCLESPDEIAEGLRRRGYAMVSAVENTAAATVTLRALWAVLDAQPREFKEHEASRGMAFHREYWAGPAVVNVPPFVLEEPTGAPQTEQPTWAETLAAWCEREGVDSASRLVRVAWDLGAADIAAQVSDPAGWLVEMALGE